MSLLSDFVDGAPAGTINALAALACAESLTDNVAAAIYEQVPVPGLDAEDFLPAFKYSGLTEPRNSEWNLIAVLRQELVASKVLTLETKRKIHRLLLSIAQDDRNRIKAGSEVPSYLFTDAGSAYHLAGAGDIAAALVRYGDASKGPITGAQWLGARLAEEQEHSGVLPEGAVETTFLRAMVLWREGQRRDAMPLFRRLAATDLEKREVAIALHILGNDNNRGQRRNAEKELRRSIEIGEKIDNQFHVAQALHSLANLLSKRDNRFDEAEKAYKRSIEIDDKLSNQFGVAKTLHSLANLLSKRDNRFDEAEDAYKRSIEILEKLDDQFGVAKTLHSLANLLSKRDNRFDEAEDAYKCSIEILEKLDDQFGVAQTLHSLANLLSKRDNRFDEAEDAYERSIEIGEELDKQFHVAQTLHSLANLLSKRDNRFDEAEDAYKRSIEILEKINDQFGVAQTLRSYAVAIETRSLDKALELLHRSLEINRRQGSRRFVRLVENTIRDVEARAEGLKSERNDSGEAES